MVFKSFRFKLVVRLILITAAIFGIVYFIQKPFYYFTVGELIVLTLILIIESIYFIEKGYRQINQMMESLMERDFTLQFKPTEESPIFINQASILNQLMKSYREIRIEKELHYQFLTHIVDQLNYGIVCFDADGKVNMANKAIKKLCGVNDFYHISTINKIDQNLESEISLIKPGEDKLFSVIKSGEIMKFSISSSTLKLLDKNYKLVSIHNIQSTLQEHELDSQKKLIRILTHEIMNSVTPILSLSESINENLREPEGNRREIDALSKQELDDILLGYEAIELRSRALMRFVNDFRSLTRLPDPNFELLKVDELLKRIFSLYKPSFDEKGIRTSVFVSPSAESIYADREMVEQIIINLLKNATDALENVHKPEIFVEALKVNDHVSILISDNGKGILAENLDKIFIPFFSTKKDGSGIGLSLSQQMMHLHKGTINCKSIPFIRTTFSIIFQQANAMI